MSFYKDSAGSGPPDFVQDLKGIKPKFVTTGFRFALALVDLQFLHLINQLCSFARSSNSGMFQIVLLCQRWTSEKESTFYI